MNPMNPGGGGNSNGRRAMNKPMGMLTKGNIGFGVLDASMNMAGGDDAGTAILKAGVSTALWHTAPGMMSAYMLATTVPDVAAGITNWQKQRSSWWQSQHMQGSVGGNYQDTQRAMTMRQAAVEAIQGSKLNARSALGGEARILNQNWQR